MLDEDDISRMESALRSLSPAAVSADDAARAMYDAGYAAAGRRAGVYRLTTVAAAAAAVVLAAAVWLRPPAAVPGPAPSVAANVPMPGEDRTAVTYAPAESASPDSLASLRLAMAEGRLEEALASRPRSGRGDGRIVTPFDREIP